MSDGDCASIDVEFTSVQAKLVLAGENLCAESLIDFEAIDLRQAQSAKSSKA